MRGRAWTIYQSPLGPLTLHASPTGLTGLPFPGRAGRLDEADHQPSAFNGAVKQLEQYFAGDGDTFQLALDLRGTAFQQRVWAQLHQIPYGTTLSYTALAHAIGYTDYEHIRAVAAAIGRTPIPIIIPCHRAVAANEALTGYLGGLKRKQALLDLEARARTGLTPQPAWAHRQLALI